MRWVWMVWWHSTGQIEDSAPKQSFVTLTFPWKMNFDAKYRVSVSHRTVKLFTFVYTRQQQQYLWLLKYMYTVLFQWNTCHIYFLFVQPDATQSHYRTKNTSAQFVRNKYLNIYLTMDSNTNIFQIEAS